jgi:MFS family permease
MEYQPLFVFWVDLRTILPQGVTHLRFLFPAQFHNTVIVTNESAFSVERKNFRLNVVEGVMYLSGAAFISHQTVLPALVTRLGGSDLAVGMLGVILWVGVFLPQIFAARYVQTLPWKKPWAIRFGLTQRMTVLLMGLAVLFFGGSHPETALLVFFFLFTLSQILLGVTTPGWFDMFGKLTPTRKRGRLAGLRNSIAGAFGVVCGLVLTWLLATFDFPLSYGIAILGAFSLQLGSIIVQSNLIEQEPSTTVPRTPFGEYLRQISGVLETNQPFRRFIIASICLVLATMPMGFYTVYALKTFDAGEAVVGEFTLTIVAAQVVTALVFGMVADRYGNKVVIIGAAVSLLCATVVALVSPSLEIFRLVFVFIGMYLGSDLLARYNISIEFGPPEQRSLYIGLMNTVLAPFYFSALIAGWVSTTFGYHILFVVGGIFSVLGVVLMSRVRDPRFSPETTDATGQSRDHEVRNG